MRGHCCGSGPLWRRVRGRIFGGGASILPGAALVALPKCPLCIAAWLTAMTGVGLPAPAAVWVSGLLRGALIVLSLAGAAWALRQRALARRAQRA